jgi:hypothetical protein
LKTHFDVLHGFKENKMSITYDKNRLDSDNNVLTDCVQCQQTFVAKYWDEELDWYIDINLTEFCRDCQQKNETSTLHQ